MPSRRRVKRTKTAVPTQGVSCVNSDVYQSNRKTSYDNVAVVGKFRIFDTGLGLGLCPICAYKLHVLFSACKKCLNVQDQHHVVNIANWAPKCVHWA